MTRLTLAVALTLAATAVNASDAARAKDLVMMCYLRQFAGGQMVDFVRRLDFDGAGAVGIADDLGSGFQYVGRARLLRSDKTSILFDFASPLSAGRTAIDRRTGQFRYVGGAFTNLSGTCSIAPS